MPRHRDVRAEAGPAGTWWEAAGWLQRASKLGPFTVTHKPPVALCISVDEELDFKNACVTEGHPHRDEASFCYLGSY